MVPYCILSDYLHDTPICFTQCFVGKLGYWCAMIIRLCAPPHMVSFSSSSPLSPFAVPVERLPMLLIANLQDIRCTYLSGSTSRLHSIPTKQTMAMDFIYANETVCWIDVGDTPAATQLKCASIPDLKAVTNVRTINISLSLHRE